MRLRAVLGGSLLICYRAGGSLGLHHGSNMLAPFLGMGGLIYETLCTGAAIEKWQLESGPCEL